MHVFVDFEFFLSAWDFFVHLRGGEFVYLRRKNEADGWEHGMMA